MEEIFNTHLLMCILVHSGVSSIPRYICQKCFKEKSLEKRVNQCIDSVLFVDDVL